MTPCHSQSIDHIISHPIQGLNQTSVDIQGNIFASKKDGEILKIDSSGKTLLNFSPSKNGTVKQLDIWSSFKIMTFYDSFQEVVLLNRFLSETARYNFDEFDLGFISNATLNFQQNLWVIDESEFSLKLIDISNHENLINQPFFQFLDVDNHNIILIKEYQNRLYVVDQEYGILIFNNLGNLVDRLEVKGIQSLGFENDTFYYLNNHKLYISSIYESTTKEIELLKPDCQDVDKYGDYIYCSSPYLLDIYRYIREE